MYQHPDLMGNGILGTNTTQGKVFDRFFAPFGEIYRNSGSETASFTGQFQDLDANLYDYEFREQSPVQGRWLNPDPSGMASATLSDPQTLNRYAYVRGSAMGMTDPNGLGSAWGWALRSFLNAAFGNVTQPPGWMVTSNWMAGNLYTTFPPFSGTATVTTSSTVTLPGQGNGTQQTSDGGATQQNGTACSGEGVPCTVELMPGGPRYTTSREGSRAQMTNNWDYEVFDTNGNVVFDPAMVVTEHLTPMYGVNTTFSLGNSTTFDNSDDPTFTDQIGFASNNNFSSPLGASFWTVQTFSVELPGATYDLATTVWQFASRTGGSLDYAFPITVVP